MAHWLLIRPEGAEVDDLAIEHIAARVITQGDATPSEAGDNPDGLEEIRVARFHDDPECARFRRSSRRWLCDGRQARRRDRRQQLRTMCRAALVEEMEAMVEGRIVAALRLIAPDAVTPAIEAAIRDHARMTDPKEE